MIKSVTSIYVFGCEMCERCRATLVFGHREYDRINMRAILFECIKLHYLQIVPSVGFYSRSGWMITVEWNDMWPSPDGQSDFSYISLHQSYVHEHLIFLKSSYPIV